MSTDSLPPLTPALVAQRAVAMLPRWMLWLLCATYVLPGFVGRDPWRNVDLITTGHALALAQGRSSWWAPQLAQSVDALALLPAWLGAGAVLALPWVEPLTAVRLPFALLLTLTLVAVWYATYELARTEAAQPVAFAFGGEAEPRDYARALADGALLAAIATLGLLQYGHETTPEVVQLGVWALLLWALAVSPRHPRRARWGVLLALPLLVLAGAPTLALLAGAVGALLCQRSSYGGARGLVPWLVCAALLAAALATALWRWTLQLQAPATLGDAASMLRQMAWFTWPALPLALAALWRWRGHWWRRHLAVPLGLTLLAVLAWLAMGGVQRALTLALPGLAVLAAFALPTLKRSTTAAIDWFSLFFFTAAGIACWVLASSMLLGVPAKPLANMQRLAPGFVAHAQAFALAVAALASLAWLALVRWRTARHRHALWKSLVLPAGGVALAWLLVMTLLLQPLDYARSLRPWVQALNAQVPASACVMATGLTHAQLAALEVHGQHRVVVRATLASTPRQGCDTWLVRTNSASVPPTPPAGWHHATPITRPTDRAEVTWVLQRQP